MSKKDLQKQKPQDKQIYLSPIPKKGQNDNEPGILNLRDLSPYMPIYQSGNTRSHFNLSNTELSIIDTPADTRPKNLYLQPIDEAYHDPIVGIINFDQNRQKQQYEQDDSDYASISHQSSEEQQNLNSWALHRANNTQKAQNKRNILNKASQYKEKEVYMTDNKSNNIKNQKKVVCKCKKTKCLKLYCDCFRINQTCEGCNCIGCHNVEIYNEERNNAMLSLIDRNPEAFKPKIEQQYHAKGCHCKKSNCLKKYCQCYQAGLKCGDNCRCQQCKNNFLHTHDRNQDQSCNQVSQKIKQIEKIEVIISKNGSRIDTTIKKQKNMRQWNVSN